MRAVRKKTGVRFLSGIIRNAEAVPDNGRAADSLQKQTWKGITYGKAF